MVRKLFTNKQTGENITSQTSLAEVMKSTICTDIRKLLITALQSRLERDNVNHFLNYGNTYRLPTSWKISKFSQMLSQCCCHPNEPHCCFAHEKLVELYVIIIIMYIQRKHFTNGSCTLFDDDGGCTFLPTIFFHQSQLSTKVSHVILRMDTLVKFWKMIVSWCFRPWF